ncbi:plasmid mobilization relaxosome protein MobC [Neomicrococcus lactis]|uniref:plasmid mobilization relaxosome protein MobC n=1 Tax=Neomicrococcus lactis TaxID=732241 RepID=UPI002300DE9A|nr:plasmid mobilization relaxosome protein MobC [Neomicrococcus lactis]
MDRKRQANVSGGRPIRREVKLSVAEDAALRVAAASMGVTVPRLLKESALSASRGETVTERHELIKELFLVQRGIAAVGNNINQIARAANATGEISEELQGSLAYARGVLKRMDVVLESLSLDGGQS